MGVHAGDVLRSHIRKHRSGPTKLLNCFILVTSLSHHYHHYSHYRHYHNHHIMITLLSLSHKCHIINTSLPHGRVILTSVLYIKIFVSAHPHHQIIVTLLSSHHNSHNVIIIIMCAGWSNIQRYMGAASCAWQRATLHSEQPARGLDWKVSITLHCFEDTHLCVLRIFDINFILWNMCVCNVYILEYYLPFICEDSVSFWIL